MKRKRTEDELLDSLGRKRRVIEIKDLDKEEVVVPSENYENQNYGLKCEHKTDDLKRCDPAEPWKPMDDDDMAIAYDAEDPQEEDKPLDYPEWETCDVNECKCENTKCCDNRGAALHEKPYSNPIDLKCKCEDKKRSENKKANDEFCAYIKKIKNTFGIIFENEEFPRPDEILNAGIYTTDGEYRLYLRISPCHKKTYLDKFMQKGFVGRIYMFDTEGTETELTNGGYCINVDCPSLGSFNDIDVSKDEFIEDTPEYLEYNVTIKLGEV